MSIKVAIVTISDSCAAGTREDLSGAALDQRVTELNWTVEKRALVPDDRTLIAKTIVNSATATSSSPLAAPDSLPAM